MKGGREKRVKESVIAILMGVCILVMGGCSGQLSPEEYVEESDYVAKDTGFDKPGYETVYDDGNRQWNQVKDLPEYEGCVTRLKGHGYQAIMYKRRWSETTQKLWVFIDTHSGEIITWCKGEN